MVSIDNQERRDELEKSISRKMQSDVAGRLRWLNGARSRLVQTNQDGRRIGLEDPRYW